MQESNRSIEELAAEVLETEARAVLQLRGRLGEGFVRAVRLVVGCAGRVVVTGMGKSGAIAHKISATLSSTGTPSLFLHAAEGVHGDLGMVTQGDVVIVLSYSGETGEIVSILPAFKRLGIPIIALCGNPGSTLVEQSDVFLDVSVEREACPLGLAPTTSTTAMLALGDALAVCAMRERHFTRDDYARFHPGGALGRRLLLRVADVMRTGDQVATVAGAATVLETLLAITRARAGCAVVVDAEGRLQGIITDGDVRRLLLNDPDWTRRSASEVMNRRPAAVGPDRLAAEALRIMESHRPGAIGDLPVLDDAGHLLGVVTLKDLLKAGIV
ncbi:MAG: KpsF/GutQ family sugar-phosphate isomerase [Armatimonadetes bacterium]|nr:KpsF/GutQ family sugar-phosphate isomerase [Armatimonadota bacterium]